MIDAQDQGVTIANLNDQYWQDHFVRFGRVPGVDTTALPGDASAPASASPVGLAGGVQPAGIQLPNPLGPAGDALGALAARLTARDTYIRVALVVIGGALLVGGVVFAVSQTEAGGAVMEAGAKAAGTAAKAAAVA